MSANGDDRLKNCWVCFATEEDDTSVAWVRPCRCRGTTKWVHQLCLQRWVDEKQRGNSNAEVSCPQCGTNYHIVLPGAGLLLYILDLIDRVTNRVCPFVAGGILIGSMYWTAVTYGAVTVMQVLGHKEGLNVMEKADPLFLLIGLPTIPIFLIMGKMIRWEDYMLKLWRKHSSNIPIINKIYPAVDLPSRPAPPEPVSDAISATRVLCGALIMPTISTFVGKLTFGNVQSNFQRTLLGGIAFVSIKGFLRLYHKQQQYSRQSHRLISDFEEPTPNLAQNDGQQ